MIPYPPHPTSDRSDIGRNGEGGFPHSEIAGSKLAHSSPTLIAACHVLLRLYMPRHPPDALTSRLRIHTINNRPAYRLSSSLGADDISAIHNIPHVVRAQPPDPPTTTSTAATDSLAIAPRHRSKTHSQCQRSSRITPAIPMLAHRNPCLHPWSISW